MSTTSTVRRGAVAAVSASALAAGLAVAAPSAAGAAPLAPSSTTATATCSTGTVPDRFEGRPAGLHAGLPTGYWIWHNATGWHLFATHPGTRKVVFSGFVTASDELHATGVRLEHGRGGDRWWIGPRHHTLAFRFTNVGGVDLLRIGADCSSRVAFELFVNGHKVPTDRIHLGAHAVSPTSNPFRAVRVPSASV
ncbi:MAG: hypothetical protein GC157_08325 [Frankiales bacterium]|nr:hypothetical protein [Frankiales bacterium]